MPHQFPLVVWRLCGDPAYDPAVSTVEELLDAARADVESGWLPSCQLAVARDGELVVFETFGDATPATRYCVFSCTKAIVASAVWLLIGDGLLDVSQPVTAYVPEFAGNGKGAVTVEQVMLHTSGFPNAAMPGLDGGDAARRRAHFAEWTLEWEPGTRFEYHATSAGWVLADVIERVSGMDFRDFIELRVSKPLGLPRLLGIPEGEQSDIASFVYVGDAPPDDLRWLDQPAARAVGVPGGGGIMRAADLALFYQGILRNPGDLWDAAVLDDALNNVRCVLPDNLLSVPVNRTLGLVRAGDDGQHIARYGSFGAANSPRSVGHAGAHMHLGWADPETGLSFSYCTNGLDSDVMREAMRGLRMSDLAAALQ
jgi:CubicO group peptidase (beta-lactamase class C family)